MSESLRGSGAAAALRAERGRAAGSAPWSGSVALDGLCSASPPLLGSSAARRALLGSSSASRLLRCPAVRAAGSARLRGALPAAAPAPAARAARHRPAQAPPTLSAGGRRGSGCARAFVTRSTALRCLCPRRPCAPRSRVVGGEMAVRALTAEPCSGVLG